MKGLIEILRDEMTHEEVTQLFDEMFESYVQVSNDVPEQTAKVHLVKRTTLAILRKLYNQ